MSNQAGLNVAARLSQGSITGHTVRVLRAGPDLFAGSLLAHSPVRPAQVGQA